jgi:hypothetical protein
MTLNDPARRALRTFLQAFVGSLMVATGGGALLQPATPNMVMNVLLAASVAGATAVLTFLQNTLEEGGALPELVKSAPAPKPAIETIHTPWEKPQG